MFKRVNGEIMTFDHVQVCFPL